MDEVPLKGLSQNSGLTKIVLKAGCSQIKACYGDKVRVDYTGTLENGEVFECTRTDNKPIEYTVGKGKLIQAWELMLMDMSVGERCKVTCPPELGYGVDGLPPKIPPNATLIFDIELLSCSEENVADTKDQRINRKTISRGSGTHPNYGSTVSVHLKCHGLEGILIDDRDVEFSVGHGYLNDVPLAVDIAIKKFRPGEKSRLTFFRDLCDGLNDDKVENLSESEVHYIVSLTSIVQQVPAAWEMDCDSKLLEAEENKSRGSHLLQEGRYRLALRQYKRCKELLRDDPNFTEEQTQQKQVLVLACHLNRALCRLKREQWQLARDECDQAIWMDIENEKAYYRHALACIGSHDYDEAVNDLKRVLNINPENNAAKNHLIKSEAEQRNRMNSHRGMFTGMFRKFAHNDSKTEALNEAKGLPLLEPIGHWSNEMASGMMSIDEERRAFEEASTDTGAGDTSSRHG